mmetsp:Transcript_37758/g.108969  ORF Transcript_37758/g.108969 Transcript_37758/m.108969 type:complete len:305 (-) Transcript_37758:678-1592(-)
MGAVTQSLMHLLDGGSIRQRLCNRRRHLTELLVGIYECLIWLFVNDERIDLVQNEHPLLIAGEILIVPPRNRCIERLHVLRLAIAYVGLGIDAGRLAHELRVVTVGTNQALLGTAQLRHDRPPLVACVGRGDLEHVEQRLEGPEVTLQQRLVVDDDVGLLPQNDDHVQCKRRDDHRLAFPCAHLRDQSAWVRAAPLRLHEAPKCEEADHLGVVGEHEQVELALHDHGPLVEHISEEPEPVFTAARRPADLLQDGVDLVVVHEAAATIAPLHQLRPGRVIHLSSREVARHCAIQTAGLISKLGVR